MCTEKERVIKKAQMIRNECSKSTMPSLQLCNFLALYLDNDEIPIEIKGIDINFKYFYIVKTDKQRLLQIPQGSDLNELTDGNLQKRELAKLREDYKAVQVEIVHLS